MGVKEGACQDSYREPDDCEGGGDKLIATPRPHDYVFPSGLLLERTLLMCALL